MLVLQKVYQVMKKYVIYKYADKKQPDNINTEKASNL